MKKQFKNLISEFLQERNDLATSTKQIYESTLGSLVRTLDHNNETITKSDIVKYFNSQEFTALAPSSRNNYKAKIKQFAKFLGMDTNFIRPERVKEKLFDPEKLPTQEDINKILKHSDVMGRALIMVLCEGLRIEEAAYLRIEDFTDKGTHSILYVKKSKTMKRPVPIMRATRYITDWLDQHPRKNNPKAFLWEHVYRGKIKRYTKRALHYKIHRHAKYFPNKNIYPHLFRHYSTTRDLRKKLDYEQIRLNKGWSSYEMIKRYAHLAASEVENGYLEAYGIKQPEETEKEEEKLEYILCPRCRYNNVKERGYCSRCGAALDVDTLYTHNIKSEKIEYFRDEQIIEQMVEKIIRKKKINLEELER